MILRKLSFINDAHYAGWLWDLFITIFERCVEAHGCITLWTRVSSSFGESEYNHKLLGICVCVGNDSTLSLRFSV